MKTWNLGINAYGLQIGIQLSSLDYRDLVLDRLPAGWTLDSGNRLDRVYTLYIAEGPEGGQHRLQADGKLLYFHSSLDAVLRWFEADVRIYVAEMRQDLLFVHAGVVGWRGRGIVMPGRDSGGKTTLVRALLEAGASYYSDTFAVFDRQGRVHPYSTRGVDSLPVNLIVATQFMPHAEWKPKRLTPDCALLILFANAVATHPLPGSALSTLRRVVSEAVALEGPRGEAEEMADLVLSELSPAARKERRAAAGQIASSSSSRSCF